MVSASVFIQQNIKEFLGNNSSLYVTPDIPEKSLITQQRLMILSITRLWLCMIQRCLVVAMRDLYLQERKLHLKQILIEPKFLVI